MHPKYFVHALCVVLVPCAANAQNAPKTFDLKATPSTVHRGFFDASLKPVLTIDSGDVVRLEMRRGLTEELRGALAGIAAAFFFARLIRGMLYEVSASDPVTFAALWMGLFATTPEEPVPTEPAWWSRS